MTANLKQQIYMESKMVRAVHKNLLASRNLARYNECLSEQLAEKFLQIEREKFESTSLLADLSMESNPTVKHKNCGANIYFKLMRSKKFNATNFYLPILMKNLEEQENNLQRSFADMINYKLGTRLHTDHVARRAETCVSSSVKHQEAFNESDLTSGSNKSFKSIRRERIDAHLINNLRKSKTNLLNNSKHFNQFSNVCSRRCVFI